MKYQFLLILFQIFSECREFKELYGKLIFTKLPTDPNFCTNDLNSYIFNHYDLINEEESMVQS